MRKTSVFILTLALAVAIILSIIPLFTASSNYVITDIPYNHSFTKALCDKNNFCEDFEIFCKDKNVLDIKSTGSAVQFSSNWQSRRDEEIINSSC